MPRAKDPQKELERREKCRQGALRQWKETREELLPKLKAASQNPRVRAKMSTSRQAIMNDPVRRTAMFEKINNTRNTPEVREQQSLAQIRSWKDLDVRAKRISGMSKSAKTDKQILKSIANLGANFCCHPNRLEQRYIELLERNFSGQWVYTGNGGKDNVIGGKIPDFRHKSQKKLIELFGDYWHQGEDPNERIYHFAKHGYHALVIWESEKLEQALDKIRELLNLENEQKCLVASQEVKVTD